jgi:hypothetical protein
MKILEFHQDGIYFLRVPLRSICTRTQTPLLVFSNIPRLGWGVAVQKWGVCVADSGTQDGFLLARKQGVLSGIYEKNSTPKKFSKRGYLALPAIHFPPFASRHSLPAVRFPPFFNASQLEK